MNTQIVQRPLGEVLGWTCLGCCEGCDERCSEGHHEQQLLGAWETCRILVPPPPAIPQSCWIQNLHRNQIPQWFRCIEKCWCGGKLTDSVFLLFGTEQVCDLGASCLTSLGLLLLLLKQNQEKNRSGINTISFMYHIETLWLLNELDWYLQGDR